MNKEARTIVATQLDKLKVENPLVFVGMAIITNVFIWLVNHPETFSMYTGYQVSELTQYVRDGLILATSFTGYSTFKDLAPDNPKKLAAMGETEGETETL